ncbi:hypothetical protein SAMN04488690_2715 [Stenotrophomonas indicatrix]|uniref:Uncharacterized protein n=1 Tax=Stenotrophomonas indicatrix TaxID=2045451 RepID=A0A1W1H061_9GAMM|nr:hypothetical protein SAMN04488690_2715 [Stenotrophomonas indicatrix]
MQRTPTHAMPALHANNGAFPISSGIHPRMAWIHVSTKVDTHQQPHGRHPPRAAHAVTTDRGSPRSPQHSAKPGNALPFSSGIHPRMAWIHVSTKVDTHQQPRGRHPPTAAGTCRRRGGSGCGGVSRMGPRHASGGLGRTPNPGLAVCAGQRTRASGDRAYMDVLAASPATGPTPPSHGMPAFDVAVAVAVDSAGAGRSPANPPHPHLTPRSAESASA